MLPTLLALIGGYLLGSIPFGLVLTRLAGAGDIRALGSGNIGATNVLRTGRKDLAAATVILDALKGTVTVLIAWRFGLYPAMAAALGAFLGHLFPVWLGFRGGKGVATFVGCMIGLYWPAALAFAIVWLGVAFVTRYSSAAGLAASVASVIVLALLGSIEVAIVVLIMTLVIFWRHRENIARLRAGTETKIGRR
ncbi:MAG TPA: glycerol-3-phosphate 1-O-acyltransferase PlsY [Beijerinckiaceae bacterium]|jgi:glycerol-3-phosphate acyltransferase PlsY|nr:glycerol-3-phosphate 1-O-acyltransferase PlsY [Beijerinckiaceae bacterium]